VSLHTDADRLASHSLETGRSRARALLAAGVTFPGCPESSVPWLVALQPFRLGPVQAMELEQLGAAVFAFVDAVQAEYARGNAIVMERLDEGTLSDLRGLDLQKKMGSFRLDIVLSGNEPRITEVEEVYGNVGKMHAMELAYGVSATSLFAWFHEQEISALCLDDAVPGYWNELELMSRRLAAEFGTHVPVIFLSALRPDANRRVWRFCYTKDFQQYQPPLRQKLLASRCEFVNPLFHGYGAKSLLTLPFEGLLQATWQDYLGQDRFERLKRGIARSQVVRSAEDWTALVERRHERVLKVCDCAMAPEYTWGSRGVFFGDGSQARWRRTVEAASRGCVPGAPTVTGAKFLVSELVESDRYDIDYYDSVADRTGTMTGARIRLGVIFNRGRHGVQMSCGHATFVSTSRKVHLGRHAVCAPLQWEKHAHA
jgi:hypothetical protein